MCGCMYVEWGGGGVDGRTDGLTDGRTDEGESRYKLAGSADQDMIK